MNDKGMFRNNLILLNKPKVPHIDALKKMGLSVLCRIFNQSILKTGDNSTLANGHYCVKLSMTDIYEQMRKQTQKKYSYYQQGKPKINKDLLRHNIRLLIIAEVIRKVDFKDLIPHEQNNIIAKKIDFNAGKTTIDNPYIKAPYYEVLDLRYSHLERLTKLKHQKDLSYPIVQQLYGDKIADNCFGSIVRDYKNGLQFFGEASFLQIVETIKKNKVISIKDLADYCAQNLSLTNGKYKTQAWWSRQLKGFDFKQYNIKLCHNSELSKKMKLDIHGNSLVLIAQ